MFKYDSNIPDPERGDLLISEPFLPDPNFVRTVILICENNEEGTFGLVLNKSTDLCLSDVMEEEIDFDGLLNVGGPVEQNTLHFVHRIGDELLESVTLNDGLYWSGDFQRMKELMLVDQVAEADVQFFLGYSGWSAGQLREELDRQSWFVRRKATPEEVFDMDAESLWKSVLEEMGGKYKVFSNYPVDPRLN